MSYFQPQNKIYPDNQPQNQQGPMYQQPQVQQQYQGSYPPQQGGQPPQYAANPNNYVVGMQPQYGGYPQYQGYPPNQVVYTSQPVVQQPTHISFHVQPGMIVTSENLCAYCQQPYTLFVRRKIGFKTLIAFLIILFLFWPLCWLPFVIDDCKDKSYYCSQCGKVIYNR